MQSILFSVDPADLDILVADLWEAGTEGILDERSEFGKAMLRAFFRDDACLKPIWQHNSLALEWRVEQEPANDLFATDAWEPFSVGETFFIAPRGLEVHCPAGRRRLDIDSATAFGTGRHESTQLMLEAMERYLEPECTVLDVGCGSGILSAAAAALGARRTFGCDIHWEAIATARAQVTAPLFVGAVDALATASVGLALVNISAGVIDRLAGEIERAVQPGGLILLSGFIDDRTPREFSPDEVLRKGEWQCWIVRPSGNAAGREVSRVHEPVQPFSEQWWL